MLEFVCDKSKPLGRVEVLGIVEELPIGLKSNGEENPRVRLVKSKKELDELWERLTKNAKELPDDIDTRHGKPIYKRILDDETQINYRVGSRSGGETIDIHTPTQKNMYRIHIKGGL